VGRNFNGELGLNDNKNRNIPQKLPNIIPISISCGGFHSMVITNEGLFVWGNNKYGQLGLNDNNDRNILQKLSQSSILLFQ